MTVNEAQALLTSLGPAWRVFIYIDAFNRIADFEFLVTDIKVTHKTDEGWFWAKWDAAYSESRGGHFGGLRVRTSGPEGTILDASRMYGGRVVFSTVTMTDAHRARLQAWKEATADPEFSFYS